MLGVHCREAVATGPIPWSATSGTFRHLPDGGRSNRSAGSFLDSLPPDRQVADHSPDPPAVGPVRRPGRTGRRSPRSRAVRHPIPSPDRPTDQPRNFAQELTPRCGSALLQSGDPTARPRRPDRRLHSRSGRIPQQTDVALWEFGHPPGHGHITNTQVQGVLQDHVVSTRSQKRAQPDRHFPRGVWSDGVVPGGR